MRTPFLCALLVSAAASAAAPWVDDCGLEPPGGVALPPVPMKAWEPPVGASPAVVAHVRDHALRNLGVPTAKDTGAGALAGKTVYLSPGHGFTWNVLNADAGTGAWYTQRPTTNGIVEDLVSAETLDQFLVPMLLNAGAHVVPVRETDTTTAMTLVDDADPSAYAETGTGFSDSTLAAFGRPAGFPATPMDGATNPFALGKNRLMTAASTATAHATYTATLPASGFYSVYVSYTAFSARVTDAHYVVRHSGGETHFRVNQQRHGSTWTLLGRFHFDAAGPAQVVVYNDTASAGTNVSLDAVRFGGGMGFIDRGGGTSGRPRFEESARYQAQWAGAPTTVYAASGNGPGADRTNDVGTRSRFSAWVHETGEDALYLAWHTNATGLTPSTAVGTTTYVYGPNPPDGTYNFTGVAGSDRLAQLVHGELINDFRATTGWNQPTWKDRGIDSAYFGEINPSNNGEMPSILVEVAFHDAAADAAHLKEPQFRYVAARAMAQGIVKFFAEKDGVATRLFPEPPTQLAAVVQPTGDARLSWAASPTDAQGVRGAAATSYRVYQSADGLGWDEGTDVATTTFTVALPAGQARFFRVAGLNDGGESFPSATVGTRAPAAGQGRVLVVNAYDRFESALGQTESFAAVYTLGSVLRILLPRMNDGSLVRLWGDALSVNQVGFDSITVDALPSVPLTPYALVAWAHGRGHAGGAAPSSTEQAALKAFRLTPRPLLFSGRALTDVAFANDVLLAGGSAGAGSRTVAGAGPLAGLALTLDDGTHGAYDWPQPDVATPVSGAESLGAYTGSASGGAGTGKAGEVAFLGFAFDTIVGRADRAETMRRLLAYLAPSNVGVQDGGFDLDAGLPEGPDAGTPPAGTDGGVASSTDGGAGPVLSFQGGGCAVSPGLWPLAAAALLARISRRRR